MGTTIREFIKRLRRCHTSAEERDVVNGECAQIQKAQTSGQYTGRSLIKLVLLNNMDYPTEFGHMGACKQLADPRLGPQRVAYYAVSLLLGSDNPVLVLVENHFKLSLSPDAPPRGTSLALVAIGNARAPAVGRNMLTELESLLSAPGSLHRRQAALAIRRIIEDDPTLALPMTEAIIQAINTEQDSAALLCLCQLTSRLLVSLSTNTDTVDAREKLKPLVPRLAQVILMACTQQHNRPAPSSHGRGATAASDYLFAVQTLPLLQLLVQDDSEASDMFNALLEELLQINVRDSLASHAIFLEVLRILPKLQQPLSPNLLSLATITIQNFLESETLALRLTAVQYLSESINIFFGTETETSLLDNLLKLLQDEDPGLRKHIAFLLSQLQKLHGVASLGIIMPPLLSYLDSCPTQEKGAAALELSKLLGSPLSLIASADGVTFLQRAEWLVDIIRRSNESAPISLQYMLTDYLLSGLQSPQGMNAPICQELGSTLWREVLLASQQRGSSTLSSLIPVAVWWVGEVDVASPMEQIEVLDALCRQYTLDDSTQSSTVTAFTKIAVRHVSVGGKVRHILDAMSRQHYQGRKQVNLEVVRRIHEAQLLISDGDAYTQGALHSRDPKQLYVRIQPVEHLDPEDSRATRFELNTSLPPMTHQKTYYTTTSGDPAMTGVLQPVRSKQTTLDDIFDDL